ASLAKAIDMLRNSTDQIIGDMMTVLSKMEGDAQPMPSFVREIVELETARSKRRVFTEHLGQVRLQLKKIQQNQSILEFPDNAELRHVMVHKRPVNLAWIGIAMFAAWSGAFIGILGVSRIVRSGRR
ncbi:MAG: hypothetical protein GXP29_05830, partial [Planctomycetes bacterium]|nr:hypothetical protein [Planctomycetota bacterium]